MQLTASGCRFIVHGTPEGPTCRAINLIWEIQVQSRLIKTGGRLVRHAKRLVFQLAEVLVTREMLTGILERISQLRLTPG